MNESTSPIQSTSSSPLNTPLDPIRADDHDTVSAQSASSHLMESQDSSELVDEIDLETKQISHDAEFDVPDPRPSQPLLACYCGDSTQDTKRPPLVCVKCSRSIHQACVNAMKSWSYQPLYGDDYFKFICETCGNGKEIIQRLNVSWIDVISMILFHLSHTAEPRQIGQDGRPYFHYKSDICAAADTVWKMFWLRSRPTTWKNSVASCLSTGARFVSGSKQNDDISDAGLWALDYFDTFPSYAPTAPKKSRTVTYDILEDGSLRETAEYAKRKKRALEGDEKSKLDPSTLIEVYPDIDNPVGKAVVMSDIPTHTAPQVSVSENGKVVQNDGGYRLAKSTHGIWEGNWYYEVTIASYPNEGFGRRNGNCRIGWSQISGDLQGPCGYDMFSYAYRGSPGSLFHQSSMKKKVPQPYVQGYGPGDVLGVAISLPPLHVPKKERQRKTPYVSPDLLSRLFVSEDPDNYAQIKVPPMRPHRGSEIRYFRNGEPLGVAFSDVFRGKYHAAISLYGGASVKVNFGPHFAHPIPEGYRPLSTSVELPPWKFIIREQARIEREVGKEKKKKEKRMKLEKLQAVSQESRTKSEDTLSPATPVVDEPMVLDHDDSRTTSVTPVSMDAPDADMSSPANLEDGMKPVQDPLDIL